MQCEEVRCGGECVQCEEVRCGGECVQCEEVRFSIITILNITHVHACVCSWYMYIALLCQL